MGLACNEQFLSHIQASRLQKTAKEIYMVDLTHHWNLMPIIELQVWKERHLLWRFSQTTLGKGNLVRGSDGIHCTHDTRKWGSSVKETRWHKMNWLEAGRAVDRNCRRQRVMKRVVGDYPTVLYVCSCNQPSIMELNLYYKSLMDKHPPISDCSKM